MLPIGIIRENVGQLIWFVREVVEQINHINKTNNICGSRSPSVLNQSKYSKYMNQMLLVQLPL